MNRDEIKNMSNDPDIIPGIHNYCDRWCERCPLSSRCMVFKMENHDSRKNTSKDLSNKEFWDDLSNMFTLTMKMLQEMAEERGVDLDAIEADEVEMRPVDEEEVNGHPVTKNAEAYFKSVSEWLEKHQEVVQSAAKQYMNLAESDLNVEKNTDNLLVLNDLHEIINWYHTMIVVKTKRAVMGLWDDNYEDEIQNDMNGTAKVVLISVERSMFAWNGLFDFLPEQEDQILKNLALLQKLKRSLVKYFPNAQKFIRPGFDE